MIITNKACEATPKSAQLLLSTSYWLLPSFLCTEKHKQILAVIFWKKTWIMKHLTIFLRMKSWTYFSIISVQTMGPMENDFTKIFQDFNGRLKGFLQLLVIFLLQSVFFFSKFLLKIKILVRLFYISSVFVCSCVANAWSCCHIIWSIRTRFLFPTIDWSLLRHLDPRLCSQHLFTE